MKANVSQIESDAKSRLAAVRTADELEKFRIEFLGKKSLLTALFQELKGLEGAERQALGQQVNTLKNFLEESVREKTKEVGGAKPAKAAAAFDETLPAVRPPAGSLHPITKTIREITRIFERFGFEVAEGPEVETEFHNFTALNIPLDHPARDNFDTFYTSTGQLLRSQTSTVQIRVMQARKPPLRIISPGRVYRPDAVDASHSFMFHQIEGLLVDENVTFADLKGILQLFLRELFGADTKCRFRPHFFPFTEPSVEVDIKWTKGWLEILGAGVVHPNVFQQVGIDAQKYRGFAFGLGVERIAMLLHGINDIRYFYENDLRFLRQF